jgi:hypothetical protein
MSYDWISNFGHLRGELLIKFASIVNPEDLWVMTELVILAILGAGY